MAARKKVKAEQGKNSQAPKKKVIRRRNEANEVVEIEIDDVPVEKATVRAVQVTKDMLLEQRKKATRYAENITGKSEKEKAHKNAIMRGVAAIDKRLASL